MWKTNYNQILTLLKPWSMFDIFKFKIKKTTGVLFENLYIYSHSTYINNFNITSRKR